MRRIREVIVVEGRYDKNTLSQVVDATIVTLGGFSVFNDREKVALLRRLGSQRGLILLTDSDGAGFQIRGYLKSVLPCQQLKQAYIPDVYGKEKRKRAPGSGMGFLRNDFGFQRYLAVRLRNEPYYHQRHRRQHNRPLVGLLRRQL